MKRCQLLGIGSRSDLRLTTFNDTEAKWKVIHISDRWKTVHPATYADPKTVL